MDSVNYLCMPERDFTAGTGLGEDSGCSILHGTSFFLSEVEQKTKELGCDIIVNCAGNVGGVVSLASASEENSTLKQNSDVTLARGILSLHKHDWTN